MFLLFYLIINKTENSSQMLNRETKSLYQVLIYSGSREVNQTKQFLHRKTG